MQRYVVTVWNKDGSVSAETFLQKRSALAAYKRHVEPKNSHSRVNFVVVAAVLGEYRHNPYPTGKQVK